EGFGQLFGGLDAVELTLAEAELRYARQQRAQRAGSVFGELMRIVRDDKNVRRRIRHTREVAALVDTAKHMLPETVQRRLRAPKRPRQMPLAAAPAVTVPERPLLLPTADQAKFMAAKTRFRIDKARWLLGYEPQFDFNQGMRITAAWARWANLAPPAEDHQERRPVQAAPWTG